MSLLPPLPPKLMAPLLVGALALLPGIEPVRAQEPNRPATTWTDPPPRSAGPQATPAPEAAAPQQPAADARRVAQRVRPAARRAEGSADRTTQEPRRTAGRSAERRVVVRPRAEPRVAARPEVRIRNTAVPAPPPAALPPRAYADACLEEDPRLERLGDAQAAGYMTLGRRAVRFPDGRSLKIYHPSEDEEE